MRDTTFRPVRPLGLVIMACVVVSLDHHERVSQLRVGSHVTHLSSGVVVSPSARPVPTTVEQRRGHRHQ